MKNSYSSIKKLTLLASLISLNIILSRFLSISLWNMKFGFTFVSVFLAAYLMGPIAGMIVGGVGDFLGALLFPTGTFFIGFTFTAIITGLIWGLIYKKCSLSRISISVVLSQVISSWLLNTLWISLLYNSDFFPLVITRLPQAVIMSIIQITVCTILYKKVNVLDKLKTMIK